MAKRKIVNSRRATRNAKSGGGKNSKYANKIEQQKQGRFKPGSPFSVHDSGIGLSLNETNRVRFDTYKKED